MIRGEVTIESSRRVGHIVSRDQGGCACWLLALVLCATISLCAGPLPLIQAQSARSAADKQLDKCRFLQALGMYCTWPEEAFQATPDRFVIAILGDEPNAKTSDAFFKRLAPSIKDRKLVIQRIKSLDDLSPCQILYLTDSVDPKTAQAAVKMLRGKPVLVVGDSSQFAENGGCAAFAEVERQAIRLKLNAVEIRAKKIGMDVRLSRMGVAVETTATDHKPP